MNCNESKLKEIMLEVIGDETGVAGVPVLVVERRMIEKAIADNIDCDIDDIRAIIQKSLDDWEIDKTIDELDFSRMRDLELPEVSGFTWHLKLLSSEKTDFYKSLRPEAKALIRLLRVQNDPEWLGVISKDEAVKNLSQQGFTVDDLESVYAKDTVEDFMTHWKNGPSVWCYGLVKEYEKTEEYKQWQEEMEEKSIEKEMRRYRFTEECETTGPIYKRLDEIAERRWLALEALENRRDKMNEEEYLRKKKAIEKRGAGEEARWSQIIEMVYRLPFDTLIDLRNMLWEKLPSPKVVIEFLDKKSKEKKDS